MTSVLPTTRSSILSASVAASRLRWTRALTSSSRTAHMGRTGVSRLSPRSSQRMLVGVLRAIHGMAPSSRSGIGPVTWIRSRVRSLAPTGMRTAAVIPSEGR